MPLLPRPGLSAIADAFVRQLAAVGAGLRSGRSDLPLPPLRRLYRALAPAGEEPRLRPALDELVDAINSAAASIGLELA